MKERGFTVIVAVDYGTEGDDVAMRTSTSVHFRSRRSRDRFVHALARLFKRADLDMVPKKRRRK